jgi:ribonuclease-3
VGRAAAFVEHLGLPVRDLALLEQALVHSSWLHEHPESLLGNNERLEFLGDAVVDLAVGEALYARHPRDDEGKLSVRRASLVSSAALGRLAARLDLGDYLLLGEGAVALGDRTRPAVLGRGLEAVVGALYLDLGWETTRAWLLGLMEPEIEADAALLALKSPKSRLQEWTQRAAGERPLYRVLEAVGPDHDKLFRIEVLVGGEVLGRGEGPSRRVAETQAAGEALAELAARDATGDDAPAEATS